MFYHLAHYFQPALSALNIIHYISFRTIAAFLQALLLTIAFGNWFIKKYTAILSAKAREWTPESHRQKDNTPTMGGILILATFFITSLCWANLGKVHVWLFLLSIFLFGIIGLFDDFKKVQARQGISARNKLVLQLIASSFITILLLATNTISSDVYIPFFKHIHPDLGLFFIAWASFILVGYSNAVNLTDGLDGLATGVILPNLAVYTFLSYLAGNVILAFYLHIPFTANTEIPVLGGALTGSALGFLWYNAYPAQIFMGDIGSLSLGAALALMGLMAKQEILLTLSGGIFVMETLSVILQVISYKWRGKRLFKMAPIHHHFELQGLHETKITTRLTIVSIILCMLTLITIKIR